MKNKLKNHRFLICLNRRGHLNKKGISIMVGYVLLVVSAVIISAIVYQWIKSYVPREELQCPEGVSIFIKDYSYDGNELSITFQNNGRFNIAGYFIYATDDPSQEAAVIDLSDYTTESKTGNAVLFGLSMNSLEPNNEETHIFELSSVEEIYSISILPMRFQEEEKRNRTVSCTNAKINLDLGVECTPNCGGKECGYDGCGGECSPGCEENEICNEGVCEEEASCENYCSSLGYDYELSGCESNCGEACDGICESGGDEYCSPNYCCCGVSLECESGQDIGDINGDGEITSFDADLAGKIYIGILPEPENICCGDADENGNINGIDALIIGQIASGQKESPGVC